MVFQWPHQDARMTQEFEDNQFKTIIYEQAHDHFHKASQPVLISDSRDQLFDMNCTGREYNPTFKMTRLKTRIETKIGASHMHEAPLHWQSFRRTRLSSSSSSPLYYHKVANSKPNQPKVRLLLATQRLPYLLLALSTVIVVASEQLSSSRLVNAESWPESSSNLDRMSSSSYNCHHGLRQFNKTEDETNSTLILDHSVSNSKQRHKRSSVLDDSQSGETSRVIAVSGQTIEFQCPLANELLALVTEEQKRHSNSTASKSDDHFNIIWRKDGTLLNQLNPRLRLLEPQLVDGKPMVGASEPLRSSLTIVEARAKSDEATYECQLIKTRSSSVEMSQSSLPAQRQQKELEKAELANQNGEQEREQEALAAASDSGPLKVHKFQLKLLVSPRLAPFEFPQDAQVGQRILLTCSALEGQRPISFVWLKDNQIIETSSVLAEPNSAGTKRQPEALVSVQSASSSSSSKLSAQSSLTNLGQLHRRQLADKFALSSGSGEAMLARVGKEPAASSKQSPAYVLIERPPSSSGSDLLSIGEQQDQPEEQDDFLEVNSNKNMLNGKKLHQTRPASSTTTSQLSDSAIRVRQADDYSILTIDSLELKHAGKYTCSAQNEAARVSHSAHLAINAPPSLVVEPKDGDLVSGQSTVIECVASGQPRPTLSWSRARETSGKHWDFVPIYENLRYSILPNGSLSITNVTQREQGFYMCTARNGFGSEVTKLIKITVHEPARIGSKYKTLETRFEERAELSCLATGELPLTLSWLDKEGKLIDKQDKRFIIDDSNTDDEDGIRLSVNNERAAQSENTNKNDNLSSKKWKSTSSKLIIAKTSRSDSGHYTCQAKNKHGQDKMVLNLLVQDVPDKMVELKVTNTTSSTISLRWQLGFNGNAPVTSYLIQYQSDDPLDDLIASAQLSAPAATSTERSASSGAAGSSLSDSLAKLLELEQNNRMHNSGSDSLQQQVTSTIQLKAALDALNSALRLNDTRHLDQQPESGKDSRQTNKEGPTASSNLAALAALDEAIDRTLVELTIEQSTTNLVIKDLNPYCVYRLRLAGINKIGLGEFSDWIRAKTEEAPPSGSATKISAAATGPNSIKLTWLPPDRRTWNGQLIRFIIAYRPLDSPFELNKSVEWSPPSFIKQSISLLDQNSKILTPTKLAQGQSPAHPNIINPDTDKPLQDVIQNKVPTQLQQDKSELLASSASVYALKQHLRQLLAQQQQELVAHLTNLQRSTTYLVWIQAVNNRGIGPQSHAISVKTLDDVPPSAPSLRIQTTTRQSITITWSMLSNFVSSANQYSLFYRRLPAVVLPNSNFIDQHNNANQTSSAMLDYQQQLSSASNNGEAAGPFIERTITSQQLMQPFGISSANMLNQQHPYQAASNTDQELIMQNINQQHYQQFVYTLDQLECGSIYELYMTTRNSVGKSEPSPVVTTRTLGEPPLAPANKNNLFARIGAQDVLLNLATWSSGGCPLTQLTVRYKQIVARDQLNAANVTQPASLTLSNHQVAALSSSLASSSVWPISTSVPANLLASINQFTNSNNNNQLNFVAPAHDSQYAKAQSLLQQQPPTAPFSLKNLQPSTGYELELIALNSAGHTTAQYEFVTAGLNGSRSGYTRREGVFRLDARGQPVEHVATDNNPQLLPSSSIDHHLNQQQQQNNHNLFLQHNQQLANRADEQLIPLALTMLCLVCLIISSTFCYYRLASAWAKRRRAGTSSDDGHMDDDRATTSAVGMPPSPSSTVIKSSVGNWRHQSSSSRLANNNNSAHLLDSSHTLRRLHGSHYNHPLESHQMLKHESTFGNGELHLHCTPSEGANLADLKHRNNGGNFSQSVSMRDFNLQMGNSATLNLKSRAANAARNGNKGLLLSSATIARTGGSLNQANEHTANHTDQLNCSEILYNNDSSLACRQQQEQHETSWTSNEDGTRQVNANQATNGQTYAIPAGTNHYLNSNNVPQAMSLYPQQDVSSQLLYQPTASNDTTYGGIDACIQHLLMGQQQQQQSFHDVHNQQQQQQYAILMGHNHNNQQQRTSCSYSMNGNQEQIKQLGCYQPVTINSDSASRSIVDSSSGSSSGFCGDQSASIQGQHYNSTIDSTNSHLEHCSSSVLAGNTNRSECIFNTSNGPLCSISSSTQDSNQASQQQQRQCSGLVSYSDIQSNGQDQTNSGSALT